jgi:hypothetical protein
MPHTKSFTQEGVEKAIEGGYKLYDHKDVKVFYDPLFDEITTVEIATHKIAEKIDSNQALLDPDFWKCLGVSLGWSKESGKLDIKYNEIFNYRHYMHRFIDHLIEGRSVEEFFEELISNHINHD